MSGIDNRMNESVIRARKIRLIEKSFPTQIDEENIISFFRENNQLDYTVSEIARSMGHIYNSIKYHIQQMEMEGTLVKVRKMGNGWTYQIDEWLDEDRRKEVKRLAKGMIWI